MRGYTGGQSGTFPWSITPTGFAWEVPAGPQLTVHYDITLKDGIWHEVGTRVPKAGGQDVMIFEMTLKRVARHRLAAGRHHPAERLFHFKSKIV
ncbi:MAG TPA: hypothetical protein VGO52_26590 [Hyphomonadaceae bacterium]|nr:hypothetical protein [Hyphomonadaceae bacterium]